MGRDHVHWSKFAVPVQRILQHIHGGRGEEAIESGLLDNLHPSLLPKGYPSIDFFENVQNLVEMRRDGSNAPFGSQFFRTIAYRSSDPRDKVFGLLGVSTFDNAHSTITPDYTRSTTEMSTEVTVALLKNYFTLYIKYHPWNFGPGSPSWMIDLEYISNTWRADMFTILYEQDLTNALARSKGIAPIIHFLPNRSSLLTVGISMGNIVAIDDLMPPHPLSFLKNIRAHLAKSSTTIAPEKLLAAILGPYHSGAFDHDKALSDIKTVLFDGDEASLKRIHDVIRDGKEVQLPKGTAFLTDTGRVGVAYRWGAPKMDVEAGLVAAALFGIQLPFVLKDAGGGRYKLWALAHVEGHALGDENAEAMRPGGKMREFVIV